MYKSQIPRPKKHLKYFCHDHDEDLETNSCKSEKCLVTPANFHKIEHDVDRTQAERRQANRREKKT